MKQWLQGRSTTALLPDQKPSDISVYLVAVEHTHGMGGRSAKEIQHEIAEQNKTVQKLSQPQAPSKHPVEKIIANIESAVSANDERPKAVLISTGALNPVHRMHLELFQAAKAFLMEQRGMNVIAGLMSPSHNFYVEHKLPSGEAIDYQHRCKMCSLAIEECNASSWLFVDEWEATQPYFVSFMTVVCNLDRALTEELDKLGERVPAHHRVLQYYYLCGADLVTRTQHPLFSLGNYNVLCIGRPGYTDAVRKAMARRREVEPNFTFDKFHFLETELEEISSTKVRRLLQDLKQAMQAAEDTSAITAELMRLTFRTVVEYITTHKLL